jgi:hypothetical protein
MQRTVCDDVTRQLTWESDLESDVLFVWHAIRESSVPLSTNYVTLGYITVVHNYVITDIRMAVQKLNVSSSV